MHHLTSLPSRRSKRACPNSAKIKGTSFGSTLVVDIAVQEKLLHLDHCECSQVLDVIASCGNKCCASRVL